MKVARVRSFLVHMGWSKHVLLIKVETDDGLHGWGEAYTQSDREPAVVSLVEESGLCLAGDPGAGRRAPWKFTVVRG